MLFDWGTLIVLVAVGGVVAVDGTSLGQFMVSRPFVAATLGGWIVGDPVHGALIGLVLETFHLAVLPVGAAKYPEGGPPALAAGAVYAASDLAPSTLVMLVLVALLLERVGGETVRHLRHVNVRFAAGANGQWPSADRLERQHITAIGLDLVRGMLLALGGILLLTGVARFLTPWWGLSDAATEIVLLAVVAGMLASAFRVVGARVWFAAAGAGVSAAVLLLTG